MENKISYLYKKGYTSRKVASMLNTSKDTVLRKAKTMGINFNTIPKRFDTIAPIIIKKLVRRNYTDIQISSLLKINRTSVGRIMLKNNIVRIDTFKFSKKEKAILIGTLLGDSSLKFSPNSKSISCTHSMKQQEYCKWKANLLSRLKPTYWESVRNVVDKRNNKFYESAQFYTKSFGYLNSWYTLMYGEHGKQIPKELLEYYNEFSLALHFQDDGYKTNSSYIICTDCFNRESLDNFNEMCIRKFGIYFTINKASRLYLPSKFKNKFNNIIKPYTHETMMYKLHQ